MSKNDDNKIEEQNKNNSDDKPATNSEPVGKHSEPTATATNKEPSVVPVTEGAQSKNTEKAMSNSEVPSASVTPTVATDAETETAVNNNDSITNISLTQSSTSSDNAVDKIKETKGTSDSSIISSTFTKAPSPSLPSPTSSISSKRNDTTISAPEVENMNDNSSGITTVSSSLATSLANSKEYKKFYNQLQSLRRNNKFILKECKDSKRLLDLKYQRLTKKINYIQISVIFLSTLSGFMQGTKEHFDTRPTIVTVTGITISTYISLVLSIAKYYKFDESKEKITNLREKYAELHNKLEYRMDVLGPWMNKSLWEHQDHTVKYKEWCDVVTTMDDEYKEIIATKKLLCTEFEIIMDSTSRNKYNIKNKNLEYYNRTNLFGALKKEYSLEKQIKKNPEILNFSNSIRLPDDELDNWDEDDIDV